MDNGESGASRNMQGRNGAEEVNVGVPTEPEPILIASPYIVFSRFLSKGCHGEQAGPTNCALSDC